MKVVIHVNNSAHQKEHASAMRSGFAKHGISAEFVERHAAKPCEVAVIWGFKPPQFISTLRNLGAKLLVMERGYFPNRMEWSSLGWDGLNNRAKVPECPDSGERFLFHWPGLLREWKNGHGSYVLVCGQVPGDAAVYGVDLDRWAQGVVDKISAMPVSGGGNGKENGTRWPIVFRPHPLQKRLNAVRCPKGAILSKAATLEEDLAGAKWCVTYNSNAGVESVCAGVPTITLDEGAMAWPVTSHSLLESMMPDRTSWANRLAWRQWKLPEIDSGAAWEYLKAAI